MVIEVKEDLSGEQHIATFMFRVEDLMVVLKEI